jgi:hypothetical protein
MARSIQKKAEEKIKRQGRTPAISKLICGKPDIPEVRLRRTFRSSRPYRRFC